MKHDIDAFRNRTRRLPQPAPGTAVQTLRQDRPQPFWAALEGYGSEARTMLSGERRVLSAPELLQACYTGAGLRSGCPD